jgi:ribosomal protein L11
MSKYNRTVRGRHESGNMVSVEIDVYEVLCAWDVKNPALQHLIKKALQAGNRGHKDLATDLQDIIDSAIRAKEIELG